MRRSQLSWPTPLMRDSSSQLSHISSDQLRSSSHTPQRLMRLAISSWPSSTRRYPLSSQRPARSSRQSSTTFTGHSRLQASKEIISSRPTTMSTRSAVVTVSLLAARLLWVAASLSPVNGSHTLPLSCNKRRKRPRRLLRRPRRLFKRKRATRRTQKSHLIPRMN